MFALVATCAFVVACGPRAPAPLPLVVIPGETSRVVDVSGAQHVDAPPSSPPRRWVWETDEPRARARAAREGLPLLVHLHAAWSAASLGMAREVWSDSRILSQGTPLVAVRVDLTADAPDSELWAARYGLRAVPTTLVLDPEGREVARCDGFCTAEQVLAAIQRAAADP